MLNTTIPSADRPKKRRRASGPTFMPLPYPADANLTAQSFSTLNDWHRRAVKYVKSLPEPVDDDTLTFACDINNAVLDAVRAKTPQTAADVAVMFEVFVREFRSLRSNSIEEFLTVRDIKHINKSLQQLVREGR